VTVFVCYIHILRKVCADSCTRMVVCERERESYSVVLVLHGSDVVMWGCGGVGVQDCRIAQGVVWVRECVGMGVYGVGSKGVGLDGV